MNASKQAVGLLGGSFDPVHNGHLSIARSFTDSGYISELWILLTPESPHKRDQESTDYHHRLQMLSLAFKDQENIRVCGIEKQRLSPPYYTVKTIKYLTEHHKDKKFYLCMGEDSLMNFHTWHQWKEILNYSDLLVARRPSFQPDALHPEINDHTLYVVHEPVDISSTSIRNKVKKGADITNLVPAPAARFIYQHNLYRE